MMKIVLCGCIGMKELNIKIIIIGMTLVVLTGCSLKDGQHIVRNTIDFVESNRNTQGLFKDGLDKYSQIALNQANCIMEGIESNDEDKISQLFCPYIHEKHDDKLNSDIINCIAFMQGTIVSYDEPFITTVSEVCDHGKTVKLVKHCEIENIVTDTGMHYKIDIETCPINDNKEGIGVIDIAIENTDEYTEGNGYPANAIIGVAYEDVYDAILYEEK